MFRIASVFFTRFPGVSLAS